MASGSELLKKLQVKAGARLWLINAPKEIASALAKTDVTLVRAGTAFDGAIAFAESPGDVEKLCKQVIAKLPEDGLLWFAYRKGEAAKDSGLSRDAGWSPLNRAGFRPVRSIAFDDVWTGLRFRETAKIKSRS